MRATALVGGFALLLDEATLVKLQLSLIGGAFFHILPETLTAIGHYDTVMIGFLGSFSIFSSNSSCTDIIAAGQSLHTASR
ncbi:hypothetical protein [Fodinibius sediminis]|uniref:Uncharacterized protein n=1 Tax=Fodinibius sediminis TaxID=1214077 RepID=A0A521BFA0_9BACT|nr:hypothetical protein [Fodinibius sediminis]SMO45390.1 hypothetical protein SAMN06265218_10338 [Fodinibius sediminis]